MDDCILCERLTAIVVEDAHWTVRVNDDQAFVGRCSFVLRRHETDLANVSDDEIQSLWRLLRKVKAAVHILFTPDHYNFVFLMNVAPHVHAHLIPRYQSLRSFEGYTFVDNAYGSHFDVAASQVLSADALERLASAIRANVTPLETPA
jgi:diadenosine tetraphosphate (Ap4A) HIT family hydrolase